MIVRGKYKGREGKVTQVCYSVARATLAESKMQPTDESCSRSTERSGSSTSTESTLRSRTPPPSPSVSTHPTLSSPRSRSVHTPNIIIGDLTSADLSPQLDKDRKAILERKGAGAAKKEQGDVEMTE